MIPDMPGWTTPGFIPESTGAVPVTANSTFVVGLEPPSWICIDLHPTEAFPVAVNVAVAEVELFTTRLLTVTPKGMLTTRSGMKFVPVRVTLTELPRSVIDGETLVSVGGAIIVKVTGFVVPPGDVIVKSREPVGASLAIENRAVAEVGLNTETAPVPAEIPVPPFRVAVAARLVPLNV
jgi:hypothetical protein